MSPDVRDLLANAAAEPRRPFDARAVLGRASALRRRRIAYAAFALMPFTAAAALLRLPADTPVNFVSAPERPGIGFGMLDDGTRVYVVRHEDGTVSVLDAVSTHRTSSAEKQVGWCAASRGFQDPLHGSRWDEWGVYTFGPASSNLPYYRVVRHGDGYVVGERVERPGRGRGIVPDNPQHCYEGEELMWDGPGGGEAKVYDSLDDLPEGRYARIDLVVHTEVGRLRVCDVDGAPCLFHATARPPYAVADYVTRGTYVVRREGDVLTSVILVRN